MYKWRETGVQGWSDQKMEGYRDREFEGLQDVGTGTKTE